MTKKNKIVAVFLAVILFFAMLLSLSFIVREADHDCLGEECQICAVINTANETLKNVSSVLTVCAFILFLTYLFYQRIGYFLEVLLQSTPVKLKVELLN